MTYSYKYSSCNDNPLQFGVYFEETVSASSNVITTTYPPATELRDEFLIIDPDGNIDDNEGIIGLWRTTGSGSPPVDVFGYITGVTKAGVISMDVGAVGDEDVLIKYYVAPQTYANPFPPVATTKTTSAKATKEILQCLLNKCQYMSPLNLFRMGYRYAHVMGRVSIANTSAPWDDTAMALVFQSNNDTYYDYFVDHDYHFLMVFTEIRVYSDSELIRIAPSVRRGDYNSDDYFGELGNNYFDLSTSTTVYEAGDSGNYLLTLPIGPVMTSSLRVKGCGVPAYPSSGDDIIIEVSGYYKPLSSSGVF